MLHIYTDGATSSNGSVDAIGGYAWIILNDDREIISYHSEQVQKATNNICELLGIITACEKVLPLIGAFDVINIYSDSAYCINCKNQKWYENWQRNGWLNSKKDPVANQELWERLVPFFDDVRFTFIKVKGHANDKYNIMCDELAVKAKSGEVKNYDCFGQKEGELK